MTLSDRIAAAQGPDRALECRIMLALEGGDFDTYSAVVPDFGQWAARPYLRSIDAAISTAQPAMQEHVMREALKIAGANFIVGKFTETLARAICEVSMKERGL